MKQIKVSAPGKLMLLGEHAVVHGKTCLVTAVDQRLYLKAEKLKEPLFILNAPDVDIKNYQKPISEVGKGEIPKGARFIEIATKHVLKKFKVSGGVKFATVSQFKSTFGFGSSSASAVCTIKALSHLFRIKLKPAEFFDLAYQTVIEIQGVGSGFDLAAAIYGGTLLYIAPGKLMDPVKNKLSLIVGYTGVKADTPTLVKFVNAQKAIYDGIFNSIFENVEELVLIARKALKDNDLQKLGAVMNINEGFLEAIGVGSDKLSALIYAAREAGAYGAKLSGAGGGDCMIAVASQGKTAAVKKAIQKAGGTVLDVRVNAEGVRIER